MFISGAKDSFTAEIVLISRQLARLSKYKLLATTPAYKTDGEHISYILEAMVNFFP